MIYICTQENLARSLSIVGHLANKSITLPILSHVLVKTDGKSIKLQTTNLELAVTSLLRGKVEEEGELTVPAKLFADFVTLLPNDHVECKTKDSALEISCKHTKTEIRGIASTEFPIIPSVTAITTINVSADALRSGLQQVVFAASPSETRPEISGVIFSWNGAGTLTLAATDSYRLSERQIPAQGAGTANDVIVPAKTAHEVLRILGLLEEGEETIEIAIGENQVGFSTGNTVITSRVIEGRYPDYRQIIPQQSEANILIDRLALARACRSAGLFSRNGLNDVQIRVNKANGMLTVVGRDSQTGEQTVDVPCAVKSEDAIVTLNYRYLLDGLNAITNDRIALQASDANSAVILRPDDPNIGYLYIVMPIKQ
jgi:DNA polymerase III subunit beta